MTALRTWRPVCALLLVLATVVGLPASAYQRPSSTERVSFNPDGSQRSYDSPLYGTWSGLSVSSNGRYVAFSGVTSETTPGLIPSGVSDVFLHDRVTGRTTMVSVAANGGAALSQPGCPSGAYEPAVSDNGRYVAFTSCYMNLTGGPEAHLWPQVYVRDMKAGKTFLASESTGRVAVVADSPSISADGRRIAFISGSPDVFPGCSGDTVDEIYCKDVQPHLVYANYAYVRDMKAGTTKLASVSSAGVPANAPTIDASISPDGRDVAFVTAANNLAANDKNYQCLGSGNTQSIPTCPDLYVHNTRSGHTELISVGLDGNAAQAEIGFAGQIFSVNGRYVAFQSFGRGLVPNGTGGIYVRDRKLNRTERVSVDPAGQLLNVGDGSWTLDATGRYVAFDNVAIEHSSSLLQACSVYVSAVHDSATGGTDAIGATDMSGRERPCDSGLAISPKVSADGRFVAFVSDASDLVRGDTNEKWDVFVQDHGDHLGAGALVRSGKLRIDNADAFAATGVADSPDAKRDVADALSAQGGDLTDLSVAYRHATSDLFFRLRVLHMPLFALASPAMVYGADFTVGQTRYELRAAKSGLEASFGLFRLDAGQWRRVATLAGGYGTTGQEVVMSVPLATLGAEHGAVVSRVTGFAGIGTFATGVRNAVDQCLLAGGSS